jgi:hypothetical protein
VTVWNTLFDAALSEIGVLEAGGTGATADRTYCLGHVNRMLSGWSAEIGPIFAETVDSLTWASGNASRTIGTGADLNTTRPEKVIAAYYRDGGDDIPIAVLSHQRYQAIWDKALTSSDPRVLAYNPTMTTGTLYMWPVPSGNITLRLVSYKPFTAISDATQDSGLPSGYEAAIVPNLAIRIAPAFGAVVSPDTRAEARKAKAVLTAANLIPQPMKPEYGGEVGDEINLWTNE